MKIFDTRNFRKHRWVTLLTYSSLWDKTISTENRDLSLVCTKFFETRNFLKHRGVTLRIFSSLWDKKISRESRDISLLCTKRFDTRFFLKDWRVPLRNFSVLWDKLSESMKTAPILFIKVVDTGFCLKHRRAPLRNVSVLWWDKKFSTENRDTPPARWSINFFDTRTFLKHRRVPHEFFWQFESKIFKQNCATLPFA